MEGGGDIMVGEGDPRLRLGFFADADEHAERTIDVAMLSAMNSILDICCGFLSSAMGVNL